MPLLFLLAAGVAALALSGKFSGTPKRVYPPEFPDPSTLNFAVQEFPSHEAADAFLKGQGYILTPLKTGPMETWLRDTLLRVSQLYKGKTVVARLPEMGLIAFQTDPRGGSIYVLPP